MTATSATIAFETFLKSPHRAWNTAGAALHEQVRAIHHTRAAHGVPVVHQNGPSAPGDRTRDGNSYGQKISLEVHGVDGKTSSPTRDPTSSSQNKTLRSLSDLFGVIGRREDTSILTTVHPAGTMTANLSDRTKSSLVCLISNAEIRI